MGKPLVSLERLKALLRYDPETGRWFWAIDRHHLRKKGDAAGCMDCAGYIIIKVDKTNFYTHRLAWLYMTGEWPRHQIDHIDRNRSNNRWSNLREATKAQNGANSRKPKNNTSGYKGVSWHKSDKKWHAQICSNGEHVNLGMYDSKEEAYAVYVKAAKALHGGFAFSG